MAAYRVVYVNRQGKTKVRWAERSTGSELKDKRLIREALAREVIVRSQ